MGPSCPEFSSQLLHWLTVWFWKTYFFLGLSSPICQRRSGTHWSPQFLSVLSFWFHITHKDRVKVVLYLVDQEQMYFFSLRYSNISYFLALHWDYSLYGTCFDFKEVTIWWVPTACQVPCWAQQDYKENNALLQDTTWIRMHMTFIQVELFTYYNMYVYMVSL